MGTYYAVQGGSRILNASRVDQSGADDADVVDWALADNFILACNINSGGKNTAAAQYKLRWQISGGAFADVASTGAIKFGSTDLVNGATIAVGGRKCDSYGSDTWQTGYEVEGTALSTSIDLADEYETEIHFSLSCADAAEDALYEFELYDATKGETRGTCGATLTTLADTTPPTVVLDTDEAYDFGAETKPALLFTGTDVGSPPKDITYQLQIDTVDTFDSQTTMFDNYNVLIESASEEQAIHFINFISKIIRNHEFLNEKVGLKDKWSAGEIGYNGGKIVGKGIGSEVRGGTYDLIVVDDVLRSDNKLSDDDIENFIDEELEPMIFVRKGQMVVIGTKKSATDIFESLKDRAERDGAWKFKHYQSIIDWEKHIILCPDRFTWDQLMQKRLTMGYTKFDKEFQCIAVSRGSRIFSDEVLTIAKKLGTNFKTQERAIARDGELWDYYMGIDTARAGTASADFTVAFILAYNPKTHKKRLCWIWRKKGMKIKDQVREIGETALKYNFPVVLVEKNNLGQDFIDELVAKFNLTIESFTTTPKSKEDLIRFLVSEFENERIILPCVDKKSRDMTNIVVNELSKFVVEITKAGNEIMKGSGKSKDDTVIAFALANKATQAFSNAPFMEVIASEKGKTELELYSETNDLVNVIRSGI